jgi:hypothetical protein
MTTDNDTIGPMKQVVLDIKAGTRADKMDITSSPVRLEFTHGLGKNGLTPLELGLDGLGVGEEIVFKLTPGEFHPVFEHIPAPSFILPVGCKELFMHVHVHSVASAKPRDVIREMASLSGCGDDCCGH